MKKACDVCGKGSQLGQKVSHSTQRSRKVFQPNLHWVTILVAGKRLRMRLCAKCIRQVKKSSREQLEKEPKKTIDEEVLTPAPKTKEKVVGKTKSQAAAKESLATPH